MLRQFIARIRSVAVVCVAAATLGIASLTACGVKGPLKLPPATPATPVTTGTDAGGSTPEAEPAATTSAPDAAAPRTPETKP